MADFREKAEEQNRLEGWGLNVHIKDMLLSDLLQQWLERKERSISPSTLEGYRRILQKADPYFRELKIIVGNVTPAIIERYLQSIETDTLSSNTVRKHLTLLRSVFNENIKDGALMFNPAKRVSMPKYTPYQATTYTADEVNALLEKLQGNELEDNVYLASVYGLRRSEVCGLRWEDIDFAKDTSMSATRYWRRI